jgi:hypothetical protein
VLILTHHSYVLFVSRVRIATLVSRTESQSRLLGPIHPYHISHFPAHYYLHSENGTAATYLTFSPFLFCSLPRASAVAERHPQQIPNGPAKLTRLGVDRVGCKKQNRMILVQKPSHGVLLAERAGRESLVQSFQSGIRFLWLFAHEPDR